MKENRILSVIVLYNQTIYESASYKGIKDTLNESHGLLIYDNSPGQVEIPQGDFAHYKHNPDNPGVSAAYNYAAEYAMNNGYEWILILDQDTMFPDSNYLDKFYETLAQNPDMNLFCPKVVNTLGQLLSPVAYDFLGAKIYGPGLYSLKKLSIINSGMIIRLNKFQESGGYNEKVFLDLSDHQFISKFRKVCADFFLLDYKLIQNFSNQEIDVNKSLNRFRLYHKSWRNFEPGSFSEKIYNKFSFLKHLMALSLKFKTLNFIKSIFE